MIITDSYSADGIFDSLTEGLESGKLMKIGILCMIAGLLGCAIIIVCGVSIILSVLSRFFKIFMCIPLARLRLPVLPEAESFPRVLQHG